MTPEIYETVALGLFAPTTITAIIIALKLDPDMSASFAALTGIMLVFAVSAGWIVLAPAVLLYLPAYLFARLIKR